MKTNPYTLRALRASASATRSPRPRGGFIAPELRHETAEKVIRAVIRRIEFPRWGEPIPLSATDRADAMGAGMLACVQCRFFDHGIMSLGIIRAIRNAIQGPECLRMRRTWETSTDKPAEIAAQVGFMTEFEDISRTLTQGQREIAKEIMRTLRAALAADKSRKRDAYFKARRSFFFMILGELTGRTPRAMSPDAFRQCTKRFQDYLAQGARALRATRKPPRLDQEILSALAERALA